MRRRTLRGLHRPPRWAAGTLLCAADQCRGRRPHHDHRGLIGRSFAPAATGVDRRAGAAMWLLSVRHVDGGGGPVARQAAAERGRHQFHYDQPMPLRDLSAGEARHFAGEQSRRQRKVNRAVALSRRGFIAATLAAGGSVLFYMRTGAQPAAASATAILLNGWIRIAPDGTVTVFSRATELGQGALTSLALIVAEELVLDPASVAVEMAPVTEAFMDHGYYATWGSLSSRDMDRSMRKIAATVRVLLLRAAAQRWSVAETECNADNGIVRHSGGRTSSYAALAPTAASLPVPQDIEPRARADWRRLGRTTARFDIPAKTDGSAIYGVDVKRPGLLVATIAQCPMF